MHPRSRVVVPLCGGGMSHLTDCKFNFGYCTYQGKRASMEDYYQTIIQDVDGQMVAFFGVYDGHGGDKASKYLKDNLFQNLARHPDFIKDTKSAIVEVFRQTNADFLKEDMDEPKNAGSTAATALLIGHQLYVANVGDSRVVACKEGPAVPLSNDHKPDRPDERQRIEKAGGFIIWAGTWRVGGVLAVSRAFGDKVLKDYVIPDPEITVEDVKGIGFIIIASDGLWNVVSNEKAVKIVEECKEDSDAAWKLVDAAVKGGSSDNITCIVVRFNMPMQ